MLGEGYWLIPNMVLYSKELTDKQKLLFCAISNLCAEKGYCRASNEYLWELLWVNKWTISKNIATLNECWFITIENGTQRKIAIAENHNGGCEKSQGGVVKNHNIILQENNTIEKKENKKRKWFGEFGMCYLTDEEHEKVMREYWPKNWELLIKQVDNYCASKWKKYKNYVAAIRNFAENGWIKKLTTSKQNEYEISDGVYDIDKLLNNLPS